jgi:hypothetical protein
MTSSSPAPRRPVRLGGPTSALLLALVFGLFSTTACSPSDPGQSESDAANERPADPGIRAEDLLDREEDWPNIVALVEPWTPPGAEAALKKGYRGALIRVIDARSARIDFGRHGKYDVPIGSTDLLLRTSEVEAGKRHKVAPNFLAHFGTQFLHPSTLELVPFPTPELAKSDRFLCLFADPRGPEFAQLAQALAGLADVRGLQPLFFPLGLKQDELQSVRDRLQAVGWPVPFAYPEAAERHAESLLGEIPARPTALLVTGEGRLLDLTPLDDPAAVETLRSAAALGSSERHDRHDFVQESP